MGFTGSDPDSSRNAGGGGGRGWGYDDMFGSDTGAFSTRSANGTVTNHPASSDSSSGQEWGMDPYGFGPAGWMQTKTPAGNVVTHGPSGESENIDYGTGSSIGPTVAKQANSLLKQGNPATDLNPYTMLASRGLQFLFGMLPQQQWNYNQPLNQEPGQPNGMGERQGTGTDKLSGNGPQRQFDDKNDTSGNQRVQTKQSEVGTTVNTIPVQTAADTTTLNPEEAAATAKEEEKKAARQRVGLMQMRAIDPLFMEGLPSIFRSMAR